MFDYNNNLKVSVTYDDSFPWPLGADGEGYTLELADSSNLNAGTSWFEGCINGSPGTDYVPCSSAIQEDSEQDNQFVVFPNPSNGIFTIYNIHPSADGCNLELYNVFGAKVYSDKIVNCKSHIVHLDLLHGIYFYKIVNQEKIIGTGKLIIQ